MRLITLLVLSSIILLMPFLTIKADSTHFLACFSQNFKNFFLNLSPHSKDKSVVHAIENGDPKGILHTFVRNRAGIANIGPEYTQAQMNVLTNFHKWFKSDQSAEIMNFEKFLVSQRQKLSQKLR
jgi:hypothetical protein